MLIAGFSIVCVLIPGVVYLFWEYPHLYQCSVSRGVYFFWEYLHLYMCFVYRGVYFFWESVFCLQGRCTGSRIGFPGHNSTAASFRTQHQVPGSRQINSLKYPGLAAYAFKAILLLLWSIYKGLVFHIYSQIKKNIRHQCLFFSVITSVSVDTVLNRQTLLL